MTRPDLDAIEARANAATPGPWNLSADRETITQTSHVTRDVWTIPRTHEDMELIAAARTDIPTLVAYARELEATLANERGEGEPPVQGWKWADCAGWGWAWVLGGGPDEWIAVHHKPGAGWYVRLGSAFMRMHAQVAVSYDTARAAMRAASVPS